MVSPECDEKIPDEDELHLSSGFIRLEVVANLGWIVRKLIKQANQFPLAGFGEGDEEGGGLGREDRLVWVTVSHDPDRRRVWIDRFSYRSPFPS